MPFSDIADVVIAEKEIELGHVLLHVLKGVLLGVGRFKASVFGQYVSSSQRSENGITSTIFYSQKLTSLYSCPVSLHRTFSAPVHENTST